MNPKLLTPEELSEWFKMPVATLSTLRNPNRAGKDPIPFIKLPNGKIRYPEDKCRKWLERNTFEDTFDAAAHRKKA
jgi:hypothetical protein